MKRLLMLFILCVTSVGYSIDRFQTDSERTQEIFLEVNENLIKLITEIKDQKMYQIQIIDFLSRINEVAQGHRIETWYQTGQADVNVSRP